MEWNILSVKYSKFVAKKIESPTERKGTRSEARTSNNFDTLSKKEQPSTTENNRAKIWIVQIYRTFLESNPFLFGGTWIYEVKLVPIKSRTMAT